MSKKFLFVAMILSAGLIFGSCGKEEEQAEEVVEEVVEEVIDSIEVVEDTVVEEVVEEVAAPAPKKAAKKTTVKASDEGVKLESEKASVQLKTDEAVKSNDRAGAPKLKVETKNTQLQVTGKQVNVSSNNAAAEQPKNATVTISK